MRTRSTINFLEQVADVLSSITAPSGSSRIKRRSPLSVSINAYLSGNIGWESWDSQILTKEDAFVNFALSMPTNELIPKI